VERAALLGEVRVVGAAGFVGAPDLVGAAVVGAEDVGAGAGMEVLDGDGVDGGAPPLPPWWWCRGLEVGADVVGGAACGRTGLTAGVAGDPLPRENAQPSKPPGIVPWLDAPTVLYAHVPPLRADQ
jgi:hypothetical protein